MPMRKRMRNEKVRRGIRTGVWVTGALVGAALLLTLTVTTWGTVFPIWVGIVVVAASLLCGDIAERSWLRIVPRIAPDLA